MKKTPRFLLIAFFCFLTTFTFAQVKSSNYSTYSLEVVPYKTQYGNTLDEKDIDLAFRSLRRVTGNGDLYMRVNFRDGLQSNYLLQTAIPGVGFAYRVEYKMPTYRVSIIDNEGNLLLQKNYGGEKRSALFGELESISSVEDLKFEWELKRDEFYANLESQPEEIPQQEMTEELIAAIEQFNQPPTKEPTETIAENAPSTPLEEEEQEVAQVENARKRPDSRPTKPKVNIYRRPEPKRSTADDPSEPKLNSLAENLFELNGFIEVDACSKYSYQMTNKHPISSFAVTMQTKPENDPEEIVFLPGETKYFNGLPHRNAWIKASYPIDNFQEDLINQKENINFIIEDDENPRIISTLLDTFFAKERPNIIFSPKFHPKTDEITDFLPEDNTWKKQLSAFLENQQEITLSKTQRSKIVKETQQLLTIKALRKISEKVENTVDEEDGQMLIYPIIKASKNFKNITPFLAFEYSQSVFLNEGINAYWNKQKAHRASFSFRLPFEWQMSKKKSGTVSTLHLKASFESLTLDFNQDTYQGYAIDPISTSGEPEPVLEGEQFSIQATQLSAGLAWKLYLPLPIIELEGGAFFNNQTRLLWGEDQGQFPRNLFSPENEIITNVVDLSGVRPYFGAKIAVPYYFSGYKFDCDSNLRNVHLFAAMRMYPVDFSQNDNYNLFIEDAEGTGFTKIPLEEGNSKFLLHLMLGAGVEF